MLGWPPEGEVGVNGAQKGIREDPLTGHYKYELIYLEKRLQTFQNVSERFALQGLTHSEVVIPVIYQNNRYIIIEVYKQIPCAAAGHSLHIIFHCITSSSNPKIHIKNVSHT